jgi:hypothetical protein
MLTEMETIVLPRKTKLSKAFYSQVKSCNSFHFLFMDFERFYLL